VVIVADPPHRPALEPLPLARVEAQLTEHAFPARPVTVQPDEATAERVLAEIAAADVAHLACHGFAELDAPLDSGLNLAGDEVLRLRDLLARRSKLRLAVLSACETSMLGTELPDEVVSLPTGLLQAGVGGVVASLWAVQDTSTALLMAEFYRQWRGERVAPPEALRAAQLWLRDSSNAQKSEFLLSRFDEGLLPAQPVTELVNAIFDRGAEDDSHLQAWAGFVYVGA
jgi:CHAT domain-containing protein